MSLNQLTKWCVISEGSLVRFKARLKPIGNYRTVASSKEMIPGEHLKLEKSPEIVNLSTSLWVQSF